MDTWTDRQIDRQTDGQTDGQRDRWIDGQTDQKVAYRVACPRLKNQSSISALVFKQNLPAIKILRNRGTGRPMNWSTNWLTNRLRDRLTDRTMKELHDQETLKLKKKKTLVISENRCTQLLMIKNKWHGVTIWQYCCGQLGRGKQHLSIPYPHPMCTHTHKQYQLQQEKWVFSHLSTRSSRTAQWTNGLMERRTDRWTDRQTKPFIELRVCN